MSENLFAQFRRLTRGEPLQVGEVVAVDNETATVELPGGGLVQGRGATTVGANVFVRAGVIEGDAPVLATVLIDL